MKIQWEQPPEHLLIQGTGRQPGRYVEFAVAIREHPGRWAVLPDYSEATRRTEKGAKATAQNIKRGKVKGFITKQYETLVDGTKVFVRYVGPDGQAVAGEPAEESEATAGVAETPDGEEDEEDSLPPQDSLAPRIRAWARANGIAVPERGRISRDVIDRYMKETRENHRRGLQAVRP